MDGNDNIIKHTEDWRSKGFDENLSRAPSTAVAETPFIGGSDFDAQLDDMLFSRMLKLKNLPTLPQGNSDVGKIFWDSTNKKYKIWLGNQWGDVQITTTSTSSTSSSSSSTSTT